MTEQSKLDEQSRLTKESQPTDQNQPDPSCDAEQLRVLVADFEAQLESVAELVARVRHEINNPLTGVLGQAQLLLREDLNEKARKRVETIESLAMRLRDIVSQLRQVQRPTTDTKVEQAHQESKPTAV